jgi:transposase
MAAIPGLEAEDAKRPGRVRENLVSERTRIGNRIKSTLARLGIRGFKPTLPTAARRLELSRQAILTVKAEHVATFLGHKITPQLAQQIRRSVRNPDREHLRQASFRQILEQDLRQICPRPAHRDHHQ